MDWTVVIFAAMVGGGLFVAVRSLTAGPSVTHAIDRLEQYAAASTHNPLMPSVSAVVADTQPRTRPWRKWLDNRGANKASRIDALSKRTINLADVLDRADLQLRPYEWWAICAGAGVVAGAIFALRVHWLVGLLMLILVPTVGGQLFLRRRVTKRLRAVDGQLSDVLILLGNGLRAGYSFPQALNAVAVQARPPLGKDLSRVKTEIELGVPIDEALRHFADRVPTEDIDLVVTAVAVTRVLGGNLSQILELIAKTVRERVRIQGEIRTLTAQARASGWIVTILPLALTGILELIAPDYFSKMFHDPIGIGMLVACLISMFMGGLIIKKIVTIDV